MNITNLTNILSDQNKKQDLLKLIARQIEIEQHIESYSDDLDDIKKNAQQLGLKPAEFNKIVKSIVNSEATLNQMVFLELLNDNLLNLY